MGFRGEIAEAALQNDALEAALSSVPGTNFKSDLLIDRFEPVNKNGSLVYWAETKVYALYIPSNGANTGWHDVGASSTAYSVVATGDYTGSGTSDILFRNAANGDTGFYQIANGANAGWHDVGASSTAYHIAS